MFRRVLLIAGLITGVLIAAPTPARADCASPTGVAGDLVYNSTFKLFQYCNGSTWVGMSKPGTGSGGCASPTLPEGQMNFNTTTLQFEGCAGNTYMPITPAPSADGKNVWVKIRAGENNTCGIKDDGTLWCWGYNLWGILGNGDELTKYVPTPVYPWGFSGSKWIDVESGSRVTCGLRDNGTGYCWGDDSEGSMGNGSAGRSDTPQPIDVSSVTGTKWTMIRGAGPGAATVCGIRDDGTAWCWGDGDRGEIGNGTTADVGSPTQVSSGPTGTAWVLINPGVDTVCGIRNDGTAWCWGTQNLGGLGNGVSTNTTVNTPQAVNVSSVSGTKWTDLSQGSGSEENCGIRDDGSLWCWGSNGWGGGAIGDGTVTNASTPSLVLTTGVTGTKWTQAAIGNNTVCALRDDGSAWCWGWNTDGVLGGGVDASAHDKPVALNISGLSGTKWEQISVGASHACGLRDNGVVYCWGINRDGQLGLAEKMYTPTPLEVSTAGVTGTKWVGFNGKGKESVCALRDSGYAYCWGNNEQRASTDTHKYIDQTPYILDTAHYSVTGTKWMVIDSGNNSGCGIRDDGTAWCWGGNSPPGAGGSIAYSNGPRLVLTAAPVTGSTWTSVTSSGYHNCGIRDNGTGYCWGYNYYGDIGNGTTTTQYAPAAITLTGVTGGAWTQLAASIYTTCGVRDDGSGYCWGDNNDGEIGDGTTTDRHTPVLVSTTGLTGTKWAAINPSYKTTCGLRNDGSAWCWGFGGDGEIGDGTTNSYTTPQRVYPYGLSGSYWTQVSAGHVTSCGVRDNGAGYCWGANSISSAIAGLIGNGVDDQNDYLKPQRVTVAGVSGTAWITIIPEGGSQGTNYYVYGGGACGLRDDGTLWCWGSYPRLGTGVDTIGRYVLTGKLPGCGNPTGTTGALRFNAATHRMAGCNGVGWIAFGPSCHNSPNIPAFTPVTGVDPSTGDVLSNIVQITNLQCPAYIDTWGASGNAYRICSDATCSAAPPFTTLSGTILNGQYVQVKLSSNNTYPAQVSSVTLDIDNTYSYFNVTPTDWKIVFATGPLKPGQYFIGLAAADAYCQSQAPWAPAGVTYKAWLSTDNAGENPAARFTHSSIPYRSMASGRPIVANNWTDLTDGTIASAITDRWGGTLSGNAWTNTKVDGTSAGTNDCSNWTSSASGSGGKGSTTSTTATWTDSSTQACSASNWVYCFEQ